MGYMVDRSNIKLPEDEFERHNERRKELGQTWSQYLDGQAPDHQERMIELQERQADALEAIAGILMMQFEASSGTGRWSPESLYEDAELYGTGGDL